MTKPAILAVDDDANVLRSVERDLRREYAERFRVIAASSGDEALDVLQKLKQRNEPVALLLIDQRMPHMTGVDLLEKAITVYPDSKRALLTAYADTEAAIQAINSVKIDYYFLKPWDPPEEKLYPPLSDLLDDWLSTYRPQFEGIRVVGNRWSSDSYRVKDFLARNLVPYQWLDVEADSEACSIYVSEGSSKLPLVVFPDGSILERPDQVTLAGRVGLRTHAEHPFYDLIIVGGGPAGLAAAVYGASEGLCTLMLDRIAPGGQAATSSRIENYLGFPAGLSGADLARRAVAQARRFGVEILSPQEVESVEVRDQYRIVKMADGKEVSCHALLIASGVSYRKLDVPGIEPLTGVGVYYGAAMTEAIACKDEDVYIVGGANSAGQAAIYFSRYARQVVMIVRADSLEKSMSQYLIDEIRQTSNISVELNTSVVGVQGGDRLECVTLENSETSDRRNAPTSSLFIFIGAMPRTECFADVIERDDHGFILTGPDVMVNGKRPKGWPLDRDPYLLETSVPGIFAAGDVRHESVKRVASAVGEGSMAVRLVHQFLADQ
ncbi:MAG TPA: FAD-dependent oxidoreductase [Capsulimonadaceae bacterium]|nr:FAD-dependent oxidoreductase [Capsulimonadaceae bacterium]